MNRFGVSVIRATDCGGGGELVTVTEALPDTLLADVAVMVT